MSTLVLFCALLAGAAADSPAADVARLVRQLDSDELTARDDAERQLIALGPAALPHLPADNPRASAEVAQRLGRVRVALQKARSELAASSSTVTLDQELPLAEALAALAQQSGNAIIERRSPDQNVPQKPVPLHFAKVPFWQALDTVLDEQQLDVDHYQGEPGLLVVPRSPARLPRAARASYSGPLRLEPTRFEAVRDLRSPASRSLKLFVEVAWEPRLKPILISQPLDQVEAVADGQSLRVDGQGEVVAPIGDGTTAVELEVPLAPAPPGTTRLERLAGKLKVLVPADVEAFRFADLPTGKQQPAKKLEQRKGAVTVGVDGLRKNNELWEVHVRVKFDDPAAALDSYLSGWLLNNSAAFEREGQMPIEAGAFEQTRQTVNEIGVKYLFELPEGPKGWTFVYRSPTAVFTIPVQYEFKNLELP